MNSYDHFLLPDITQKSPFSPKQNGGGNSVIPNRDRVSHARILQNKFDIVWTEDVEMKHTRRAISLPTRNGTYLEFKGAPDCDLIYKSLEDTRAGIKLLNVRESLNDTFENEVLATIFIPNGKERSFLKKLESYANPEDDNINEAKGTIKPKNADLINSIEDIKLAVLSSFWTDNISLFPTNVYDWFEIWIKIDESKNIENQIQEFQLTLNLLELEFKLNYLKFPERVVILVRANLEKLNELIESSDFVSEMKQGQESPVFWIDESPADQSLWVDDLLSRLIFNDEIKVSVCILDTGVNNGHKLLAPHILDENCLTCDPNWGNADKIGHGTQMAGVVCYGDISNILAKTSEILVEHNLCSVKILPNEGVNNKELWGLITEQAVYRAEAQLKDKKTIYCMAITSPECENNGKPSSWSGALDKIISDDQEGRLILVSGGNIKLDSTNYPIWNNYPDGNSLKVIQNPAQSWNALTIGAYTNKVFINDHRYDDYQRVAPSGGISPYSTTSILWAKTTPMKPEVVFEGGNILKTLDEQIQFDFHDDLAVLTTHNKIQQKQFDTICATSAATALASNFAAKIAVKYPNLWHESIRGLIVHSASWTETMERQFPVGNRENMKNRMRFCGYGVPSENKALFSTENAFTFIAQEVIKPYTKERGKSNIKLNEMHFFDLPWPKEILESIGEVEVTLKITLSYFIEPSPGEMGWKDKYRYASHGLRFDINMPTESEASFKGRINKLMHDEEEIAGNDSQRWTIGSTNRNIGSIHSDMMKLTATQIAACNLIAVYPIGGWWKTRNNLKKYNSNARYSLIISLETPILNVDLYSVVKTKIETLIQAPIPVEIPIG